METGRLRVLQSSLIVNPCECSWSSSKILSLVVGPGVAWMIWIIDKVAAINSIDLTFQERRLEFRRLLLETFKPSNFLYKTF
jgi:hypothetical protein